MKNLYEKYRDSFVISALSICFYNLNKVSQNNKTVLKKYLINELFPQLDITQHVVNTICPKSYQAQFAFLYSGTLPKVSIVLPIYNAEPYLRECLNSVINQTLNNIEIICVNDGSTDKSLNIIKEYALKDIRLSYIDKPNAGYGQTMNCGIAAAKGEYISIVEPDDFIKPDMYEILYNKAKELDLDIVKSDYLQFETINGVYEYKKINIFPERNYYNRILSPENDEKMLYIMTINPAGIFRRKFLEENNIYHNESPGASYQDNGFFIQTMYLASKIYFMDKPFYCYRQDNPNQSIHQKNKVKGRLSYPDMYHEMQNADYFLTLLDPENSDHDRYISSGTSGSFQLIYGFKIPCLIADKFAKVHGFNQSNAFVYKDNKDLVPTMLEAINLKDDEYNKLRNNISVLAESISNLSLDNLKKALASPMPPLSIKERFCKMFCYSKKYEPDSIHISYKLFGCLPFLSKICKTRKSVYKIWGINFWKIKKEKNGKKIKHFLFGLPILKYKHKNEYTTKIYFMGIPLLKRTEK